MSISVVIPMLNERESIRPTVEKLHNFLNSLHLNYEIIVVDDGSTDGSSRIIDELSEVYPFLEAIHFYRNAGIGEALRVGFNKARKDIILYVDSDLPVDMSSLKEVLDLLNKPEVDMVVGYRAGKRESILRVVYTRIYNLLIRWIFRINLRDINCPIKAFRRKIIKHIKLESKGAFIDAELLLRIRDSGFKIAELKVTYVPRKFGYSKFASPGKVIGTITKICLELIKFCRK